MRVLLTGAAGNVGLETLRCLLDEHHDVTVLELDNQKNRKRLAAFQDRILLRYGSINDELLVRSLVIGQDAVIHLAAIIPPLADRCPELTEKVNFAGTGNVIDSIRAQKHQPVLLFASSISVYGDRVDDPLITIDDELKPSMGDQYAAIKIRTEGLIRTSGIPYVIFRLTGIMGHPATDPLMFHMPLATKIEFASNVDTGYAFAKALDHLDELKNRTFNLGGGMAFRTDYQTFLRAMLLIYGLNMDYLDPKAFAKRNFHCGWLADGAVLNDILHFQRDDLAAYYARVKNATPPLLRSVNQLFGRAIMRGLQKRSEPWQALNGGDQKLIDRFYGVQ